MCTICNVKARMGRLHRYPAKAHLRRVVSNLSTPRTSNFIFLKGASPISVGTSDQFYAFEQESNFYYCSGADHANWYLLYDIAQDHLTFFIPQSRSPRLEVYFGQNLTPDQVLHRYEVDEVKLHDSLGQILPIISPIFYTLENSALVTALTKARSTKDQLEIALIKRANNVSSTAHESAAKAVRHAKSEIEIDTQYRVSCAAQGHRKQAYSPIVGSGVNASILHYADNDQLFGNATMIVIDAAVQIEHYAADVTRTYPIDMTFTAKGAKLYAAVLDIQKTCIRMLKPGTRMSILRDHAHQMLAEYMVSWNWINCSKQECLQYKLTQAFLMHGIGHHIGLDVHDVTPTRNSAAARAIHAAVPTLESDSDENSAPLGVGAIVTVEPGIYFNMPFLKYCYSLPHGHLYNREEISSWEHLGGCRIEDCVLITMNGHENLTPMVKEIEDIEKLCSGI